MLSILPTCPWSSKWPRRTAHPFDAIKTQFGLDEAAVIALTCKQLKPGSFRLRRDRVHGRKTKHSTMRSVALKGGHWHQARYWTPQR
jgi:uncharacterized protein (TIGR03643 family)